MRGHSLWITGALILACHGSLAADPPAASDVGWIAGHWCGGSGDERIEEYWMPPHGGLILGLARTLAGERTASYEYTRIVVEDGVPVYIAQPQGGAPVAFRRTAGGADWARFENVEHNFPTRVEYRRTGDALHAEIGGPGADGQEIVIPFDYVRCAT